MNFHVKVV